MKHESPLLIRFLDRLLPSHHALVGDLEFMYHAIRTESGALRASFWLWSRLLTTVPYVLLHDLLWERHMLKNYFIVALRQILRYRAFSAINVLGLAFSLSVSLLILGVLHDQGSFDEFHPEADRLYRLTSQTTSNWGTHWLATSSAVLGRDLADQDLGIEALVQLRRTAARIVRDDGRMATFEGLYAPSAFFDLFGFELAEGDPATALTGPRRMVLSPELAVQLFPDRDPIGQIVENDDLGAYTVTGVLGPLPSRTHLRFQALVSFDTLPALIAEGHEIPLDSWPNNYQFYNYMKLEQGATTEGVVRAAVRLGEVHNEQSQLPPPVFEMQQITDVNLGKDLSNEISQVVPASFGVVVSTMALILVLMAVFNYVNLTTARSMRRIREIGIRKVVGAHRRQLFSQFMSESVLTALLAFGAALLMLQWLIPQFNSLTSLHEDGISLRVTAISWGLMARFVVLALGIGLLAGIIPALRLSREAPVRVLKGLSHIARGRKITLRKSLTVLQFAASMVVIVLTITLFRQASYVLTFDYGFDQEQLLHVDLSGMDYDLVRDELDRITGVELIAGTSAAPSVGGHTQTDIRTADMEESIPISTLSVDDAFLEQYRIELVAGRNFSPDVPSDEEGALLLTASALPYLGIESVQDAVGTQLTFNERPVTVVGVISDFYAVGFEHGLRPVALDNRREGLLYAAVRVAPGRIPGTLRAVDEAWESLAPGLPLNWTFFNDQMNTAYGDWRDMVRILSLFAFLIVVIASLGLLGMTAFTAEIRLREVGIRKVLGANVGQVISLLSGNYVRLVLVAAVIAAPVSYILADKLLALSANHVDLGPLSVLAGVLPVLFLALVTIASQTWRAAVANPAEVIRDE